MERREEGGGGEETKELIDRDKEEYGITGTEGEEEGTVKRGDR